MNEDRKWIYPMVVAATVVGMLVVLTQAFVPAEAFAATLVAMIVIATISGFALAKLIVGRWYLKIIGLAVFVALWLLNWQIGGWIVQFYVALPLDFIGVLVQMEFLYFACFAAVIAAASFYRPRPVVGEKVAV